jgi:hypothetical protein
MRLRMMVLVLTACSLWPVSAFAQSFSHFFTGNELYGYRASTPGTWHHQELRSIRCVKICRC